MTGIIQKGLIMENIIKAMEAKLNSLWSKVNFDPNRCPDETLEKIIREIKIHYDIDGQGNGNRNGIGLTSIKL